MAKKTAVDLLKGLREEITGMGVSGLAVFGPAARGEDAPGSEVHLMVQFRELADLHQFIALRDFLSTQLGRPVELVVEKFDHPQIWPFVEDELVIIL